MQGLEGISIQKMSLLCDSRKIMNTLIDNLRSLKTTNTVNLKNDENIRKASKLINSLANLDEFYSIDKIIFFNILRNCVKISDETAEILVSKLYSKYKNNALQFIPCITVGAIGSKARNVLSPFLNISLLRELSAAPLDRNSYNGEIEIDVDNLIQKKEKYINLKAKYKELEEKLENLKNENKPTKEVKTCSDNERKLQASLQQTIYKLEDQRNECSRLKNELNKFNDLRLSLISLKKDYGNLKRINNHNYRVAISEKKKRIEFEKQLSDIEKYYGQIEEIFGTTNLDVLKKEHSKTESNKKYEEKIINLEKKIQMLEERNGTEFRRVKEPERRDQINSLRGQLRREKQHIRKLEKELDGAKCFLMDLLMILFIQSKAVFTQNFFPFFMNNVRFNTRKIILNSLQFRQEQFIR